jgi:F-box interacting protein
MTSEATGDEAVVFGDEFVADEILARLPFRCAARCTALSKRFRQLLVSPHFWFRHRRLGAPPELPHVARLYRHFSCKTFDFHVAGRAFAMKHTLQVEHRSFYASTCNGLVLVSSTSRGQSSVDCVVFNPATREEARLSLPLPHPQNMCVERYVLGFGYGPSSKVYKALIKEDDTWLMVVSLDGSDDGQEPRKVFSCSDHDGGFACNHSLDTGDGKVYFLIYTIYFTGEDEQQVDNWEATAVLAFDVDDEVVTSIAVPEGRKDIHLEKMLEIRGRPCIFEYERKGQDTVIWLLTTDHMWEKLYILVKEADSPFCDSLVGAWDCGGGLLFAMFTTSGAYLYNLHQPAAVEEEGGGKRLLALSSMPIEYKWPDQFNNIWLGNPTNLLDYQPTVISPANIFGDACFSGRPPESVALTHDLDGLFFEMTKKSIVDPAMQMLSNLHEAGGLMDSERIGAGPLTE